jgi:DNA polymerase-3 subunit delta'
MVLLKGEMNNNFELFSEWLRICLANKGGRIIEFVDIIAKSGRENQKNFFRYGIKLLRESLMLIAGAEALVHLTSAEREFARKVSTAVSMAKIEAMVSEMEKAHYHIERNANPKILFLDVSLQFVMILKFNTLPLTSGTQYILS